MSCEMCTFVYRTQISLYQVNNRDIYLRNTRRAQFHADLPRPWKPTKSDLNSCIDDFTVGEAKIVNFYYSPINLRTSSTLIGIIQYITFLIHLFSTIASPVVLQPLDLALADLITQLLNQIMETNDSPNGDALSKIPLRNADSTLGLRIADPLLTVEQDNNTSDNTAFLLDDAYSLAQGRSCRDHVVDDDNPLALQWGTDDISTLTMILGLLAVE